MARKRKKSKWRQCEGVNSRTGKLLPGYRALHRGQCPIAVIPAKKAVSNDKVPYVEFDYVNPTMFLPGTLGFLKKLMTVKAKLPGTLKKINRPI